MIRTARPGDLPALRAIGVRSLSDPWQELLDVAVGDPLVALVAVEGADTWPDGAPGDGSPVGYAVAIPDGGAIPENESSPRVRTGGDRSAYLAELAVAPDHRRRGHGSALLDGVCDRLTAAGHDRVTVTARADDERALAFYRRHGFTATGRLPDHYGDADGLALVRSL